MLEIYQPTSRAKDLVILTSRGSIVPFKRVVEKLNLQQLKDREIEETFDDPSYGEQRNYMNAISTAQRVRLELQHKKEVYIDGDALQQAIHFLGSHGLEPTHLKNLHIVTTSPRVVSDLDSSALYLNKWLGRS